MLPLPRRLIIAALVVFAETAAAIAAPSANRVTMPVPALVERGEMVLAQQRMNTNCTRAAAEAAAMTGGEVLSAMPVVSGRPICRVTVLVINARGRPKRVRLRIPM